MYCAVLLYKLNRLPIDKVFDMACDSIATLPRHHSNKHGNPSKAVVYSLHLWRLMANVLGPLDGPCNMLTEECLKRYRSRCKYWNDTVLSESDVGDCDPYPIAHEMKPILDKLASLPAHSEVTDSMIRWHDFLAFDIRDADLLDAYFQELLLMYTEEYESSSCYCSFSGSTVGDVDVTVSKVSFPAYANDIWNLPSMERRSKRP